MLQDMLDSPTDAGSEFSWLSRLESLFYSFAILIFDYWVVGLIYHYLKFHYNLSIASILLLFFGLTIFITLTLYIYYVYLIDIFEKVSPSSKSDKKGNFYLIFFLIYNLASFNCFLIFV